MDGHKITPINHIFVWWQDIVGYVYLKWINGPQLYRIKVKGHIDKKWADWFEGMRINYEGEDIILTGYKE